ncbi:amino acid ABC transporter permease [Candidatus Chloroploca sp. M-50]|uniref:Amino acid ABC transporter permease n=1 Tax=Candidatus Chloroploca mongolica TaxID=2528176 RepID=A0ABS4D5S4_9CHLR|nr:amino acid ABC transporter permease [Candidatus Chloroploca mongolica]MBP1464769.1 amino acid ABC transporter permease [Candidatus Chloroploca mongolica]
MTVDHERPEIQPRPRDLRAHLDEFPWWLLIILSVIGYMVVQIIVDPIYRNIFNTILQGLSTTLYVTAISFVFALIFGLFLGLGRVSNSVILRNLSITYIEFIRGVPMLVLIFTISYAVVPLLARTFGLPNNAISLTSRAIIALVLIYGAYIAEVFRAGIEAIGRGQMEAGRSLGMSRWQTMLYVILPQATRNMLPALGNDLIALLKDTSLVSVLGVREITQVSRLSVSTSFRYEETYFILTLFYLSMTLILSLLLQWIQRRAKIKR